MGAVRYSESYVWSVSDVIGQGATGYVYKCRHKATGAAYAAKVFNSLADRRPSKVRCREIDVLKKLDHPNIVKLETMEQEHGSLATVLVMELCETSLHHILEEPKNALGLEEKMFKDVIWDVTNGMRYLRECNVVHRDVKPGNILQARKQGGGCIYKITDFGAARELREADDCFMSIYGTEEYLHPDIYEKAVIKKNSEKTFTSSVDLWSLGVTFYHLATGELPFRPFGGRNNKDMMFKMISEKDVGVISGVQAAHNSIPNYEKRLPEQTRIPKAMKDLLTPVLQGLLETDRKYMITYEEFFTKIEDLVSRRSFDIYASSVCSMVRVYLKPSEHNFSHLQEAIAQHTQVKASDQRLYFNHEKFCPDSLQFAKDFPEMTTSNPLILISPTFLASDQLPKRKSERLPKPVEEKAAMEDDANLGKIYASYCNSIKRAAENSVACCTAVYRAQENVIADLGANQEKLSFWCNFLRSTLQSKYEVMLSKKRMLSMLVTDLIDYQFEDVDVLQPQQCEMSLNEFEKACESLKNALVVEQCREAWKRMANVPHSERWLECISADVKIIEEIYLKFNKDKYEARPGILDDLTHKAEKNRLLRAFTEQQQQMNTLEEYRCQLHDAFASWMRSCEKFNENVDKCRALVQEVYDAYSSRIDDICKKLDSKYDACVASLQKRSLWSKNAQLMTQLGQIVKLLAACQECADEDRKSLELAAGVMKEE